MIIQATIHTIEPFDSAVGTTISFTWNGNQIYKVRCVVKVNATGATAYDGTVSTMRSQYTIPANSGLVNGTYYVAYITVFDINDTESDMQSVGMPFYCFTTPTFQLSISEGAVIGASNHTVTLSYSQKEDEPLNYYQILLYSYQRNLIQSGDVSYDTSDMYFMMTELENAKEYYVRATGTTVHGMTLDTGYILFNVAYVQSQIFSTLELNNMADIGAIEIRTNIIAAEGEPQYEPVIYVDGGGVDLRDNAVIFRKGWNVGDDFTAIFRIQQPALNKNLITLATEDGGYKMVILYRQGRYESTNGELMGYFELRCRMGGDFWHVIMSNFVSILDSSKEVTLYLQRINGHFTLYALESDI